VINSAYKSAVGQNLRQTTRGGIAALNTDQRGLFMIIIINGSLGVGKSSVAEELHWKFDQSIHLDGDHIGNVHPFNIYDEARIAHLYQTLALLVGFHQKYGYHNFVINYVFESPASLQALHDLLQPLDAFIHTYWLTCAEQEQARRIQGRQGANIEWELKRFVELHQIQAQAAQQGFIGIEVDTTHLTSAEVAEKIWNDSRGH
jgi:chloramphenicol 3-O-phosphotransferase